MAHSIDTLVSSRICHDLISPVGAIGNGLELLDEVATTMPEIGLIADSVDNAKAKLMFFRICFGQTARDAQMGAREVETIATAMIQTPRITLEWQMQSADFTREQIKLLFLLLLCVETALPIGGTIVISEQGDRLVIEADSTRIQMHDTWQIFSGEKVDVTPAQVQFPLAQALGNIRVATSETNVTITF